MIPATQPDGSLPPGNHKSSQLPTSSQPGQVPAAQVSSPSAQSQMSMALHHSPQTQYHPPESQGSQRATRAHTPPAITSPPPKRHRSALTFGSDEIASQDPATKHAKQRREMLRSMREGDNQRIIPPSPAIAPSVRPSTPASSVRSFGSQTSLSFPALDKAHTQYDEPALAFADDGGEGRAQQRHQQGLDGEVSSNQRRRKSRWN